MESTIIAQEMLDELAEAADLGPKIAEITARAMAGELDFEAALDERVALLEGLPTDLLERLAAGMTLNPGAITLVRTLRAHGGHCALVTGGFDVFAQPVAKACGFHEVRANHLETGQGIIRGRVSSPVLGRSAKRKMRSRKSPPPAASPRKMPAPSATAPTTFRCWRPRVWAWPTGPSRCCGRGSSLCWTTRT